MYSKKLLISLFLLIVSNSVIISQIRDLEPVPTQYENVKESVPVTISESEIIIFYINPSKDSIFSIKTNDLGISWEEPKFVHKVELFTVQEKINLAAIKTNTDRIILAWAPSNDSIRIIRSDDYGTTWSNVLAITGGPIFPFHKRANELVFTKSANNRIFLSYNKSDNRTLWFKESTDNGDSWSEPAKVILAIPDFTFSGNIVPIDDNNLISIFIRGPIDGGVYKTLSSDGGNSWNSPEPIFITEEKLTVLRVIVTDDNKIWIFYQKEMTFNKIYPPYIIKDIYCRTSSDVGLTWSDEQKIVKYAGDDNFLSAAYYNDVPLISFSTTRFTNKYNITFLIPEKIEEISTPPVILYTEGFPVDSLKNKFGFKALTFDDEAIKDVQINLNNNQITGQLYDDGEHFDGEAGDSVFANVFDFPKLTNYENYVIQKNNIVIPVNNKGIIASVRPSLEVNGNILSTDIEENSVNLKDTFRLNYSWAGGLFDDVVFLFASGFVLSGLDNSTVWSNAVASATLVEDYLPGNVDSNPDDPDNKLYVINSDDIPFGSSWHIWKNAVDRGAEYYDGDGDGFYNPVDKNFNGIWDKNEDMPMILGDETVWCVYNDALPDLLRRWESPVKKIEIAQTIFTSTEPELENIMFIRYKIINKSTTSYDSVYFGFWSDVDLGEATNDKVGCDTLLNSGYTYNSGPDWQYGDNPPAFFTTLLQGPVVESISDSDTAYIKLGEILGEKKYPGAFNQNLTSFIHMIGGDPELSDANSADEARNYLKGLNRIGGTVDPCTFPYGHISGGINCSQINPHFLYSGDPVTDFGWLCRVAADLRQSTNTGPFNLKPGESVEIIGAYIVGRGTDPLNSITVTREITERAIQEYKNNFSSLTYKPGEPTNPIISYELYQNYPNPFNPSTTIRYAIPMDGIVKIKVYDILGQEVKTLVNEFKKANRYEVKFNSEGLSSGVYIYRLEANDFSLSNKMIILK